MKKVEVGQKIYIKPINNASRYGKEIIEETVTKVGRKYFQVSKSWLGRFFIDTMNQDNGDYMSNYLAYGTLEEIEQEKEESTLYGLIEGSFRSRRKYPIETLRKIWELLNSDIQNNGASPMSMPNEQNPDNQK